ncbi:MAG: ABC-2 family transporter protein [Fusobacteriaceae bacterium]|nr:ABC-2 family transporter protein [Fusobacteriaceae bacterium]
MKNKETQSYPSYHKYVEYFKIGFKKSIEYKSYLIGTLTTPFFMGIFFYFIWQYIFEVKGAGDPNFLIGGFTFVEMIVYLVIGLLINTARASDISDRISQMIKSGDIAIMLCRPVNFVKSLLADSFGSRIINIVMFFFLLLGITKVAGIHYPPAGIFALFIVYGFLLIFFDIVINVMIGGLAFWLTEIWGVRSSIQQVLWILSGRALPLSLFPTWMIGFLKWTPFFYLEYTFASIYLGKLGFEEALRAMGIFMVWIVIMVILMRMLYTRGFSKLTSFGG